MLIPKPKLKSVCKGFLNAMSFEPVRQAVDRGGYFFRFGKLFHLYRQLAMMALDFGFGPESARGLLAQAAWAYVCVQQQSSQGSSATDMPRALFCIGTCHDTAAATSFCTGYLDTPEARRGEIGPRGPTPYSDDHYWHFANVLALFHAGDAAGVIAGLDEIRSLPPRKQWKHSGTWFKAMTALVEHCLIAPAPDPWPLLRDVAVVNQRMFARDPHDLRYEAWFGEIAMSFGCAAQQRGWEVPDQDPHPSIPLALLRLPPIPVPNYPWDAPPPQPDPELIQAIKRVAKGLEPIKRPTAAQAPGGEEPAGRAPARKAASARARRR